jgi:hypothetical protein
MNLNRSTQRECSERVSDLLDPWDRHQWREEILCAAKTRGASIPVIKVSRLAVRDRLGDPDWLSGAGEVIEVYFGERLSRNDAKAAKDKEAFTRRRGERGVLSFIKHYTPVPDSQSGLTIKHSSYPGSHPGVIFGSTSSKQSF